MTLHDTTSCHFVTAVSIMSDIIFDTTCILNAESMLLIVVVNSQGVIAEDFHENFKCQVCVVHFV